MTTSPSNPTTGTNADVMDGLLEQRGKLLRQRDWYLKAAAECDAKIEFAEAGLREFAIAHRALVGRADIRLPHGSMRVTKARDRDEWTDAVAFNSWAADKYGEDPATFRRIIDHAAVKARLELKGDCYVSYDGEVAPGLVRRIAKEGEFTVTIHGEGE